MTCDCWPNWCCCCCGGSRKSKAKKKGLKALLGLGGLYSKKKKMRKSSGQAFDLEEIEEGLEGYDELETSSLMSPVFITSTLMENGGVPKGTKPTSLIKVAIHVISCGFQGLLKVLAGVDTNLAVMTKAADDAEFGELYLFK